MGCLIVCKIVWKTTLFCSFAQQEVGTIAVPPFYSDFISASALHRHRPSNKRNLQLMNVC